MMGERQAASSRYHQFEIGISRAKDLIGLGQSLGHMTSGRVDAQDMYRASLAQSVSALDFYFHGVVLDLAVDVIEGRRESGSSDRKFGLPLTAVKQISGSDEKSLGMVARGFLAERLSFETFQSPADIGKGLAMVGIRRVWSECFGVDSASVTQELSIIVRRRNRIVHQSDLDPLNPGEPTPMDADDALNAAERIEHIVETVDRFIFTV